MYIACFSLGVDRPLEIKGDIMCGIARSSDELCWPPPAGLVVCWAGEVNEEEDGDG